MRRVNLRRDKRLIAPAVLAAAVTTALLWSVLRPEQQSRNLCWDSVPKSTAALLRTGAEKQPYAEEIGPRPAADRSLTPNESQCFVTVEPPGDKAGQVLFALSFALSTADGAPPPAGTESLGGGYEGWVSSRSATALLPRSCGYAMDSDGRAIVLNLNLGPAARLDGGMQRQEVIRTVLSESVSHLTRSYECTGGSGRGN